MTPENEKDASSDLQIGMLEGREFSLAEAIAREGGSFFKGESPVPKLLQTITEINLFIVQNLPDSSGALQAMLQSWIKAHEVYVSRHLDTPLAALQEMLESLTSNADLLYEFVRQVDVKWGQIYAERPYFQKPGEPPHPDDEYTHESVHAALLALLNRVNQAV